MARAGAGAHRWIGDATSGVADARYLRQSAPPRAGGIKRNRGAFPLGNYWYLHIAGCEPAAQGRGYGAAAIRSGLDRIAGSGLPAYLETATESNLGLYRALGFQVSAEWIVPGGGPRFWSMRRG
ncbi:GNAT family N-acetyltransferase [Sphingomonas endolithica]|uniref:GNAT family N-acetyltransferase n=1 Tax=Sphingomonas endolithica TaxID=2972485 RepID=UPI002FF9370A